MSEYLAILEEAACAAYMNAPLINGQFTDAKRTRLAEWTEITDNLINAMKEERAN